MSAPRSMREDLIAYALGELDPQQQLRIEQALAKNEALREELQQIRHCLGDNEQGEVADDQVPSGLADRTTASILSGCFHQGQPRTSSLGFSAVSCVMSPVDMTVALGVLITIASLLTPALYSGRNQAQRLSCENNLQQLGELLTMYSERYKGYFPPVRPNEHAGIFASRLRDADFVRPDVLDRAMVCAGSPLAEQLAEQRRTFHVPSMAELSLAKGMWLVELRRTTSGSYGYQAGYVKSRIYYPPTNHQNSLVPVVSDAPSMVANHRETSNHGGNVVNALMQDGSVLTLTSPRLPCSNDLLYFNHDGEPTAGTQWNDAVILPSGATPSAELPPLPAKVHRIFFRVR